MAEPFSIGSGALQVAGAGVQLAKSLYKYAKSVQNAEHHISAVTTEIKLTSSVLKNLAAPLQSYNVLQQLLLTSHPFSALEMFPFLSRQPTRCRHRTIEHGHGVMLPEERDQ